MDSPCLLLYFTEGDFDLVILSPLLCIVNISFSVRSTSSKKKSYCYLSNLKTIKLCFQQCSWEKFSLCVQFFFFHSLLSLSGPLYSASQNYFVFPVPQITSIITSQSSFYFPTKILYSWLFFSPWNTCIPWLIWPTFAWFFYLFWFPVFSNFCGFSLTSKTSDLECP